MDRRLVASAEANAAPPQEAPPHSSGRAFRTGGREAEGHAMRQAISAVGIAILNAGCAIRGRRQERRSAVRDPRAAGRRP
jgi:hypothetical protein